MKLLIFGLILCSFYGCPSKTMESLKIKAKEKIEKADEKLSRKVEEL